MYKLLVVLVFAGLLSPKALAAISGDWEYIVQSNNATIIRYLGSNASVSIPSTLGGYSVKALKGINGPIFTNTNTINITIPQGVVNLGQSAFQNTRISSIEIPDTVTEFGDMVFAGSSLTQIVIPNNVSSIGHNAFRGGPGAGFQSQLTNVIVGVGVTNIGVAAFYDCRQLQSLIIQGPIRVIARETFYYSGITNLTIPNTVTNIESRAFFGCAELKSIVIPSSVKKIGESSFYFCTNLTFLTFNEGLETIDYGAFVGCSSLGSVNIPNSITNVAEYTFYMGSSLSNVVIGNGLQELRDGVFGNCTSLSRVTFLGNAPSIPYGDPFFNTPDFTLFYNPTTIGWGSAYAGRTTTAAENYSISRIFDSSKGNVSLTPSGPVFLPGSSVTVSASALPGYVFISWAGDSSATTPNITLSMTENKSVTANFGPDPGDTDGDGLSNYQEVIVFNTNPNQAETNSPVAGLYLASQYQSNRASGRSEVLGSPNAHGLFNSNQMLDLKFGGMVVGKTNNQLVLTYQINQSTNLTNWTSYREESLVISNAPADKMFLRLNPRQ